MKVWDSDDPGCAPEICGSSHLDPCVTVYRTRGRWHDGEVPATAFDVVNDMAAAWHPSWTEREEQGCRDIVAAVADWLRAQPSSPDLRVKGERYGRRAVDWAANLLDANLTRGETIQP